jgi:plasmid stabilization system protein ParE
MTLEVRLTPEAEQDFADAAAWYEEQRSGLGLEFLHEAQVVLASIAERPLSYPIVHRTARRALLHRFPFGVFYCVEPTQAVVIGILHGSRNPKSWKVRT